MSVISKIFIVITFFIAILTFTIFKSDGKREKHIGISAVFFSQPPASLLQSNQRLADLQTIAIALDKFKNDHKHYPITPDRGKDWASLYTNNQKNLNWIDGLSPNYIESLPRDARNSSNKLEQYAYQSDGANYKLIAFYPPDCLEIYKNYPKLVVTNGANCIGYGLWTNKSAWGSLLH